MKSAIGSVATLIICLLAPAFAQAKITVFQTSDALRKLATAPELMNLEQQFGPLSQVEVTERDDRTALQAFELVVTVVNQSRIGKRLCKATFQILVVKDESAPAGIAASRMLDPVLTQNICQK